MGDGMEKYGRYDPWDEAVPVSVLPFLGITKHWTMVDVWLHLTWRESDDG